MAVALAEAAVLSQKAKAVEVEVKLMRSESRKEQRDCVKPLLFLRIFNRKIGFSNSNLPELDLIQLRFDIRNGIRSIILRPIFEQKEGR